QFNSKPESRSSNDSTTFYTNVGITTKASQVIPTSNGNYKLIPDPAYKPPDSNTLMENFINQLSLMVSQNLNSTSHTNNNIRIASNPHNQATIRDGKVV
ncbi:hypothetical protein, partial [Salmonella enterica]|uniref:hypothetical protein n=1 Tax=Salmonella enterica TaxID=28901 RepID=UPI0020C296B9